jgi:hypothetical protein
LGKINIDAKEACFLSLFGGEKAIKGRHQFLIRNAQNGTAQRDWEIVHKDTTGTEMVIASVALPAAELKFEWTPDGMKNPASPALRNCAIKITAGQEKPYFVALRTPAKLPPVDIENVEKSPQVAKLPFDAVPDTTAIRLEPTVPNQKIVFDAGGPDITKGDATIYFGDKKEEAPLALKLDTSVTPRGVQVTAASYVLLPGEKPQKLTPALRKKLSVADLQQRSTAIAKTLGEMKKMKKEDQEKARNEISLAEVAQKNVDEVLKRVQKLEELIQQLNSNGKIHFRVYYDTGETQVNLVKTDDSAPPAGK